MNAYEERGCAYILKANPGAIYCGEETPYTMEWDGGEVGSTRVRKHAPFCVEHQKIVDKQRARDDE